MCQNESLLGAYALEEDEWIYLGKLHRLLNEFDTMTNIASSSVSFPTVNRAMSIYNAMIDTLEDFTEKETDESLKGAAMQGHQKLLEYYSKTGSSVYAVVVK